MEQYQIEEQLAVLPRSPGVYLFKDNRKTVIYVGKAGNLSSRVRSYFRSPASLPEKQRRLAAATAEIEFLLTDSEQEALILECNLIKEYQPRFNISLKDNKSFPYLRVGINEEWPGIHATRRHTDDGARYFGPFANAGSVRKTIRLLRRIFRFRSCSKSIDGTATRPCLNYQIQRCLGPCIGAVTREEYRRLIDQVILFLEGRQELVLRDLKRRMRAASERLQFEKAASLRDQIQAIEDVMEGQRIAVKLRGEQDVIGVAQNGDTALVKVFFIRNNRLTGQDSFIMEGVSDEEPGQVVTDFVKQYYASASFIPPLILLQHPTLDLELLCQWLAQRRGGKVLLQVPRRGAKKKLVDSVVETAARSLEMEQARRLTPEAIDAGLKELKERLGLPAVPSRIECYDMSNLRGSTAVGSMVVLEKGRPTPAQYRRFRIRTGASADDCAMIQETLMRRFKKGAASEGAWAHTPDLVLVDGGKGQLNAALQVRRLLGLAHIPMAGLAKENEDVFVPGRPSPVDLPKDSIALQILQRARDEAHRVAIGYHRRLRRRGTVASELDAVPGIGPKRKRALLRRFGSVRAVREAPIEELRATEGITAALADRIKQHL